MKALCLILAFFALSQIVCGCQSRSEAWPEAEKVAVDYLEHLKKGEFERAYALYAPNAFVGQGYNTRGEIVKIDSAEVFASTMNQVKKAFPTTFDFTYTLTRDEQADDGRAGIFRLKVGLKWMDGNPMLNARKGQPRIPLRDPMRLTVQKTRRKDDGL